MRFGPLTQYLDQLTQRRLSAVDCAVYVGDACVYRHIQGAARRPDIPASNGTIYQMFSMSKPITCTAALQLFEQGDYQMSDPLSKYLPEFADMRVRENAASGEGERPATRPILVKDLFTMTAGFGYDMQLPALRKLYADTEGRYTTRQFAQALAQEPLYFDPGTRWQYSLCHDVLGAFIEAVSGMTFGAYLQKNVFDPLGMKETFFHVPEALQPRMAHPYILDKLDAAEPLDNPLQISPLAESGGAGICCTVDDYARFAKAMTAGGVAADGTRILASRTVRLMRENHLSPECQRDYETSNMTTRPGYSYGLGVRTLLSPARANALSSVGEFGWGGAWGTFVLMDPTEGVTVVFATQCKPGCNGAVHPVLRNLVYVGLDA